MHTSAPASHPSSHKFALSVAFSQKRKRNSNMKDGPECEARAAGLGALSSWTTGELSPHVHPDCRVVVLENGEFKTLKTPSKFLSTTSSSSDGPTIQVTHCKILPVGTQSAASLQVVIGNLTGFVVTLLQGSEWLCISAALSSSNSLVLPTDFEDVTKLTWDGYCAANRKCRGDLMAKCFHETCRLTFSKNDQIQIIDSANFYQRVAKRYQEGPHLPYAHLKDDPRTSSQDSLLGIEFASRDVAMVTLRVGHPPFLWTDLLTCAKLDGQWWICHKSSCNHPFLEDEGKLVD